MNRRDMNHDSSPPVTRHGRPEHPSRRKDEPMPIDLADTIIAVNEAALLSSVSLFLTDADALQFYVVIAS